MLNQACPQVKVIRTATNRTEAEIVLSETDLDLVFLDVRIGNENCFGILKDLQSVDFQIIFITAYDRYAIDAFKFSAIDFLLKPINLDDLKISVNKAEKMIIAENLHLRLSNLIDNLSQKGMNQTIVLRTFESHHVVHIKDIIQCEAQGNYTLFHLKNKKNIIVSQTLKKYDLLLTGHKFFRCHQSHLVNMECVVRFDKRDGGSLVLENELEVPISTRKKEQLFKFLT